MDIPVRPLVLPVQLRFNHSNPNDLTETPAKVDIGGEIPPESDRTDFGRVGDRDCADG